jgi:hypothetical protein
MIAIVLCISVLLPLVFTSCAQKTPKTADELIDKVEDVMDDIGSYEQKLEMELEVWVSGTKMSMNAVGKGILIDTEEDYYYYNSMDMEMTTGSSKTSEETTRIEVYDGGKVYFLEDANEKVIAQSSDATAAEHRAYIEDKGDIDDYIYDCETKEFSKNEDGSWELVLADYEDEALDGIYESAGLGMLFDAGTIRDIKVEMLVAEDFRVLEYELKFKFNEDNDGNKPQAVFKSEFSKHGEATREKLDTDGYQSIKGLLGMKRLEQTLKGVITRNQAEAHLKIEQTISERRSGAQIYKTTESDIIEYGIRDDRFYYSMRNRINGQSLRISYENGKQTVKANSETETTDSTDLVAKATVEKILDCTGYDIGEIKSFEDKGDGVYEVKLDKKNSQAYANAFGQGTTLQVAELRATYTVKNGELVSIEAKGDVEGNVGGTGYSLDISISLSFK